MSLFKNFTIEEANAVGKKFIAKCDWNGSYEKQLTVDKEYQIEIVPSILDCSPLCLFVGDHGKKSGCHLTRFTKIREINEKITVFEKKEVENAE